VAAYATALTALPAGIWRLLFTAGVPLLQRGGPAPDGHGPEIFTGWWYVVTLTVLSEGLAFLTVGLVATWGEVVPRWVPRLGGRTIPIGAAVVPAGLGATFLTVLCTWYLVMASMGRMVNGTAGTGLHLNTWQRIVFDLAYAPLVAWGPLLGAVTIQYYRRRRASPPSSGEDGDGVSRRGRKEGSRRGAPPSR
jgi:hypothetical protein